VFPAFGMAELAIAGTFPVPLQGLRTDDVDRHSLECDRVAIPAEPGAEGTKRLVRLGRPIPGLEIRIINPADGTTRGERQVGELQIRGTSVTSGYFGRADATGALFDGEWLRTGDLGYLIDGELVLCGRIKDVIIVAGRNVFPEDVERSVGDVVGVRAGNVIAFGVQGTRREELVVVAESRDADPIDVRRDVAARVRQAVGMPAKEIVLVVPGSLPKTSSGKLQRSLCRDRYLEQDLEHV
jgi:fatty-acyl-CoA synthase